MPIELKMRAHAKSISPTGHAGTWGAVLHKGNQTWIGLDPQTLQTPFAEIVQILKLLKLKSDATVVDLGAAYGRLGIVMKALLPQGHFIGHEFVPERVQEARRIYNLHGCHQCQIFETDISDPTFQLPPAAAYFLYDFGRVDHIRKILNQIDTLAMNHSFYIVVRGETTRQLVEYSYPLFKNIIAPRHYDKFSIYQV